MVSLPRIIDINGPVVKADNMSTYKVRDMVIVGDMKLISIDKDVATIQVYEETQGLKVGERITSTDVPLSVTLGPGMVGNIFDGIQRPLERIYEMTGDFIAEGIGLLSIDKEKIWKVDMIAKQGDVLSAGQIFATVQETSFINHKVLVPPNISGTVISAKPSGEYNLETDVVVLEDEDGKTHNLKLYHTWPVRLPRPVKTRMPISKPLITGQRVIDVFFPIAKGGTSALPGGFGTGKTMTQHQLAKWSDADIIVYIGCGERGNEMTDVLEEFPKLIDPRTGKPLMERTILIANTSNMPVAAREASIYTGITIAEYYRDMGYHVAIMADSTSRWAEALREISGRLEEMPAEEGYPGGDFSEPVTENTKRFVSAFIGLDKNLAYIRHYPAVNYLNSYSGYISLIKEYYDDNVSPHMLELRAKMMALLSEDDKLNQIVQLVGEDVLPNDQRLLLEIAKVLKKGFLQQNAMHETDSYVPLKKQFEMLKVIDNLYVSANDAVKKQIGLAKIKSDDLFEEVIKMKYNIPNEDYDVHFEDLNKKIKKYYSDLISKYEQDTI